MPEFSFDGRDWRPVTNNDMVRLINTPSIQGWFRFPAVSREKRFSLGTARVAWKLGSPGEPLAKVLLGLLPAGE